MMTHLIPEEIFEIGILSKEYHARLLADIEHVTDQAGIPPEFVWSRLSQYCTDDDMMWVRKMKQGHDHGLCYIGNTGVPVGDKMMAIAGACLRNYTDARVITVQRVLKMLKSDEMPSPTVLLVPNFCLEKGAGGDIPQWEISSLLGLLYSRLAKNLKTVLYVESMTTLEKNYGKVFRQHIEAHYTII